MTAGAASGRDGGGRRGCVFVGHDIYRRPAYGTLHPLAIPRVEALVDLCRALGWLTELEYRLRRGAPRRLDGLPGLTGARLTTARSAIVAPPDRRA